MADITDKIATAVTGKPLAENRDATQQAIVNDIMASAPAGIVIKTVVDHLGLSSDLNSAEAWLADHLKTLATKFDNAVNETDKTAMQKEAQFFAFMHSMLGKVDAEAVKPLPTSDDLKAQAKAIAKAKLEAELADLDKD